MSYGAVKEVSTEPALAIRLPSCTLKPSRQLGYDRRIQSRYSLEEGSFDIIFGTFEGHENKIYASRKMAEKIETQIRYAELPKAYYQGFRYIGINYFVRGL